MGKALWRVCFEVESDLSSEETLESKGHDICLKAAESGGLEARLIVAADSIDAALEIANERLNLFLDALSFATDVPFKIGGRSSMSFVGLSDA